MVSRPHSRPIRSKRKWKDIEETTLELSTTTITQLLKPFKAALPNLVANLAEFPDLEPYISPPVVQKSKSGDTSSEESIANEDGHQLRQGYVSTCKPAPYPLTEQQSAVLEECRQVGTLHFSGLPTYDNMIKLIAISTNVCIPFFDEVLFPNVEKVIFSSKIQEKSFESRYMVTIDPPRTTAEHIYSLPHPITFALDWLVSDFSLCIHSPTSFFKQTWIESQLRKASSDSTETDDEMREKYRRRYNSVNPLGGTLSVHKIRRMRSISYHDISPGDRPTFPPGIDIRLHFSRHDEHDAESVEDTLRAIAGQLLSTEIEKTRLTLIDIEYFEHPSSQTLGPKAMAKRQDRRAKTASKVLQHMVQIIEDKKGRCLRNGEKRALYDAVEFYYETSDRTDGHICAICGNGCMESSCTEEICD